MREPSHGLHIFSGAYEITEKNSFVRNINRGESPGKGVADASGRMLCQTSEDRYARRIFKLRKEAYSHFHQVMVGSLNCTCDIERFQFDGTIWMSSTNGIEQMEGMKRSVRGIRSNVRTNLGSKLISIFGEPLVKQTRSGVTMPAVWMSE